MAVYRSKYLKEKTLLYLKTSIAIVTNLFQKSSIEWLEFIAAQTNSKILHACNSGEKVIVDDEFGKKYYVDGFCEETGIVYEFHSCVYHGCPSYFDQTNDHPFYSEWKMNDVSGNH